MFLSDILLFVCSPLYWDLHNLTSLKTLLSLYYYSPSQNFRESLLSTVDANTLDVCNKLSSKCPLTSLAWLIHSFNRYVLTTHLVPVMCFILGIGSEQGRQGVCSHNVYFLERARGYKSVKRGIQEFQHFYDTEILKISQDSFGFPL